MGIVFLGILLKEELQRTTLDNIDNAETHCFVECMGNRLFSVVQCVCFGILVFRIMKKYKELHETT